MKVTNHEMAKHIIEHMQSSRYRSVYTIRSALMDKLIIGSELVEPFGKVWTILHYNGAIKWNDVLENHIERGAGGYSVTEKAIEVLNNDDLWK